MTNQGKMYCVHSCANRGPAPIPQEGKWDKVKEIKEMLFLQIVYGRSQTAFSERGLPIGAGVEELGNNLRSHVGTIYSSLDSGPRYLEITEGYVMELGLDNENEIIGYKFINLGRMMNLIRDGVSPDEAFKSAVGTYGRFSEAIRTIDPRKE